MDEREIQEVIEPPDPSGELSEVEVDIDYLESEVPSINFDWFECSDLPVPSTASTTQRLVPVLIFSALAAGCILSLIGLVMLVRWIAA